MWSATDVSSRPTEGDEVKWRDRSSSVATIDESAGRRAVRVRYWMLTLAFVPLLGAVSFATAEVDEVAESRRLAATVSESTEELVLLTELRARVLDERNWTAAVSGVADIGFDPVVVEAVVGIDMSRELDEARTSVDSLLVAVDWPELGDDIDGARADEAAVLDDINTAYEAIAASVENRSDLALDALLEVAGDISDGSDLVDALRVLEAAATARRAVTLELTAYFGAQFTGLDGSTAERRTLTEQRSEYRDAIADVARIAGPDTEAIKALNAVEASEDVIAFRAALSSLLASNLQVADVEGFDIAGIFSRLDEVAATFQAANSSVEQHLELVRAAGADVDTTSRALEDAAAAATRGALYRIGVLVAASLLFVMGLARAIGRPLRQLAAGVRDLRDGDGMSPLRPAGPAEVREAMHAINEAAAHLELAERQARALAIGQLDSPVLEERAPGALGRSLQETVQTLASSLSQREEFRRRLTHEASHDSLTQLANRKASLAQLNRGLARAQRTGATLAIMFVDLDDFKDVNDKYGHAAGDTVLCAVGERLVTAVREGDHVGRLGGDEFLIVAEPIAGAAEAVALAERIAETVGRPISIGSASVRVTVSVGLALADEHTTLTGDELLRDADLAVYKAKELGRSRVELCDEDLRAELVSRAEIEEALRLALVRDELTLYYQPIVDPQNAELLSLEALIRWDRPEVGLVAPDAFIPVAERSDLIIAVDNWVLRKTIEQLVAWGDDQELRHLPIAVNISGRHLASDRFVADLLDPVLESGVDPGRVIVEITESALLDDLDSAARKLESLRSSGMRIAIDDFGTGYTSLAHLRTLPVDILKIDRTFTADETAASLVKLIIETGHLLGARITAEGIETPEQASVLAALGSDELQGYLYGMPVPPGDLQADELSTAAVVVGPASND